MQRTDSFAVDKTFDVHCDITKSTTLPSGRRLIRGVASGVLEDRDGERVSKRAIAEMAMQPVRGLKLVADLAGHEQTFVSEIGDVTKMALDPDTDELIVEAELPAEGEDPIADKCWKALASGKRLGYSIGGKLRKAFFELAERNGQVVKRKVLDSIGLRHVLLTERPAYTQSFVETVAKTASDLQVDDSVAFHDEPDEREAADAVTIAKAAKPKPDDGDEPDQDPAPDGQAPEAGDPDAEGNEPAAGEPAAGAADTSTASAADDDQDTEPGAPSDAEETQGLPMALRHLSCPNCGEEFAADLPANEPTNDQTTDTADEPDTGKTAEETPMDPKDALSKIRALADEAAAAVTKTETEEPAATVAPEVTKTEVQEPSDVEKMIAAVHTNSETRLEQIEKTATEGFTLVAKAVQELAERVNSLPQGRRSVASTLGVPRAGEEITKTATDGDQVAKALDEAPNALAALKVLNHAAGLA